MSTPSGRSILAALGEFASRGWYVKDFTKIVQKIIDVVQHRNEILSGGVVSVGATVSASVLQVSTTVMGLALNGHLKSLAAQTDVDLFTTAGVVGKAIYSNGADASALNIGAGTNKAYIAIIACNTDGAGGDVDTDDGAVKLVAVVAGTATTYQLKTAPPTSVEIQAALEAATGVHDGVTGWLWVGKAVWDAASGSPVATLTPNRNNRALAL